MYGIEYLDAMSSASVFLGLVTSLGLAFLPLAAACSSEKRVAPSTQLASQEPPMNKGKKENLPSIGERQEAHRQALYGVGVLRPMAADDLTALGVHSPATLPALVVF